MESTSRTILWLILPLLLLSPRPPAAAENTAGPAVSAPQDSTGNKPVLRDMLFRPSDADALIRQWAGAGENGDTLSPDQINKVDEYYDKHNMNKPDWLLNLSEQGTRAGKPAAGNGSPDGDPGRKPAPQPNKPVSIPQTEDPVSMLPGLMAVLGMPPEIKQRIGQINKVVQGNDDDDKKRRARMGKQSGAIAAIFADPKPPGTIPATLWDQWRLRVARALNQVGSEENRRPYHDALRINKPLLSAHPDHRDALNNRAASNYGLGRHAEAIIDTTRVIERHSEDERAYTTRALAYYQMKNYAQAREDAQRALALNANNETAHQIQKLTAGRVTTAADLGLGAMEQAAADQVKQEYKVQLEQQSQFEARGSLASPKTFQAKNPATSERVRDALLNAKSMIKMNDYHGALRLSAKVLRKHPENVEMLYTRVTAENLMGQYAHAVEDATAVLDRSPRHTGALDARAKALLQLGRFHEAEADATRSISIEPKNAYAYMNRARARENLGKLDGMISDFKQAARFGPQFAEELAVVAKKYDLPLDGATARALLPPGDARPPPKSSRNRRFLVILASSLTGGLLISIGLLHIVMRPLRRLRLAKIEGAGTETAAAIAAGPSLTAGYDVAREIGRGGMGVVYEATDKALARKVAIKKMRAEIRDNPRERERFLAEARIVAGLHHLNIVDIHSILEDEGELYMIFEFVEGRGVDKIIEKNGRLHIEQAALICRGVCNALVYAHRKGVIHRDLKPSNIMVTREGMVKVMDFGIARQAKDALAASTQTNTVAGTPHYMAPEQEQGIVRKQSDIFALTACLYEMITGARPFNPPATTASKLAKKYARPSRITADLPPELDAFIDAGLEPDPDKRIASAEDFTARLSALRIRH